MAFSRGTLVLALVLLKLTERVPQSPVVRMDHEQRLVSADRVVESGQALAPAEVRPVRRRLDGLGLLVLDGFDLRTGGSGGFA
jgi:hypothetical protein